MAQAKIYWDLENYAQAETIFYKSVEFCNENDTWRLHVAHVLFMQEKFKEAIAFYEPIVKKNYNNVNIITKIRDFEHLHNFFFNNIKNTRVKYKLGCDIRNLNPKLYFMYICIFYMS